jgi:hypothetical protein
MLVKGTFIVIITFPVMVMSLEGRSYSWITRKVGDLSQFDQVTDSFAK